MKLFLTLCTLSLLTLTGCFSVNFGGLANVQGTGEIVSQDIDVANFTGINVGSAFNIIYRQAETPHITVSMQENLLSYLRAETVNGILEVSFNRTVSTTAGNTPRLYVYGPYLSSVTLSGAASAQDWDTINADSFNLVASGAVSGSIDLNVEDFTLTGSGAVAISLSGNATTANLILSGACNINAADLQTIDAVVSLSGAGSADIAVSGTLDARVSGVGVITYIGNPQVTSSVTGVGSVRGR